MSSYFGAAAGYTLGATVATNMVVRENYGFVGPLESVQYSVLAPFAGLLHGAFSGGGAPSFNTLAPFAAGAVGAYMGYSQKIPILRDYV